MKTGNDLIVITLIESLSISHCHSRRRHDAVGEEFPLTDSEFADDTAALFTSRRSVKDDVPLLYNNHFARFGMEVHKGKLPTKKTSKTYSTNSF